MAKSYKNGGNPQNFKKDIWGPRLSFDHDFWQAWTSDNDLSLKLACVASRQPIRGVSKVVMAKEKGKNKKRLVWSFPDLGHVGVPYLGLIFKF